MRDFSSKSLIYHLKILRYLLNLPKYTFYPLNLYQCPYPYCQLTLSKNHSRQVLADTKKRVWSKLIIFTPNSRNPLISRLFSILTSVLLTSRQPSQHGLSG